MGVFYEITLGAFLFVTVALGGGAAYMTGRAVALTWRRIWLLLVYLLVLACAVRFIHFALFGGTLMSVQYFAADLAVLLVIGAIGFRVTKTNQMVTQYSWLYQRSSPVSWRNRS